MDSLVLGIGKLLIINITICSYAVRTVKLLKTS